MMRVSNFCQPDNIAEAHPVVVTLTNDPDSADGGPKTAQAIEDFVPAEVLPANTGRRGKQRSHGALFRRGGSPRA